MRIEYMHQWCPICQLKVEIINLHDSTSCTLITSCLVTLPHVMLASGAGSSAGCSTSNPVPCYYTWECTRGYPKCL